MDDRDLIQALSALAHGTRLQVYRLLAGMDGPGLPAGEIATTTGVAPTSLSGHLAILARAGLVTAERRGRHVLYRARPERVHALAATLSADRSHG